MPKENSFRVVCWREGRVVSMSEPMSKDVAIEVFVECVARGGYTPDDTSRLAVVSVADLASTSNSP